MAIGLVRKQSTNVEEWLATAAVARTFRRRFEEEMGTAMCRELTHVDLTSEEERGKLMNSDVPMTVCFPAVATAFRIAMELLTEDQ